MKRTKRRMSLLEQLEASVWRETVLQSTGGRCAVTGDSEPHIHLHAHHVLTQQQLRRHGFGDRVWDVRNGMPLASRVHERHTLAVERVPRDALPAAAEEFAAELGLTYLLDRVYGFQKTGPAPGSAEGALHGTRITGGYRVGPVSEYDSEEAS